MYGRGGRRVSKLNPFIVSDMLTLVRELLVSKVVSDPIAELHFGNLKSKDRAKLIKHANPEFLNKILMHYENFQASL
jgi:hypothetical protein